MMNILGSLLKHGLIILAFVASVRAAEYISEVVSHTSNTTQLLVFFFSFAGFLAMITFFDWVFEQIQ